MLNSENYKRDRSSMSRDNGASDFILRGNMGFCSIDMSLVNNCGVPSLWFSPSEYANGGS